MKAPRGAANTFRGHHNIQSPIPQCKRNVVVDFVKRLLVGLAHAARAMDSHWIGDLIGAVSLFASGWMLLVLGYGMGWQ